jgi:hypothetical protein
MASNKELIEKIKEINEDAVTEGLTNAQLTASLKLLKGADDSPPAPPATTPPAPPATAKSKGLKIAKGKCITSKRGILEAGEPVTANDFSGGADTLANLVKTGAVE